MIAVVQPTLAFTISPMRFTLDIQTDGSNDIINISAELKPHLRELRGEGLLHLFLVGSTAALTTMEYESGLVRHDMAEVLQRLIPDDAHYAHEATWNDDNGHSHVRAALIGPGLMIPFADGRLLTGEYQQIVLLEFDTRPRRRTIICTVLADV
jgi:secondary thiamine-phosphate synthase enzyme